MSDKIRVLFVDDDPALLQGLKRKFHKEFDLTVAESALEGVRCLEKKGPFSVVVSDQNMPQVKGTTFLAKIAKHFPLTVRVLFTGNNDQETAVSAVNDGAVFKFLNKPCTSDEILEVVKQAHAHHLMLKNERLILEETLTGSINLLTDMLSMTHPKAFQRANLVHTWAVKAAKFLDIDDVWELEVASKLWPLSYLLLPDDLIAKRNAGEDLNTEDHKLLAASYLSISQLLNNIPRVSEISRILLLSCDGACQAVAPEARPKSALLLQLLINASFYADLRTGSVELKHLDKLSNGLAPVSQSIFALLRGILSDQTDASNAVLKEVEAFYLLEGDVLVEDLHDSSGRLLLAAGQNVTKSVISKLEQINRHQKITNKVKIVRGMGNNVSREPATAA